MKVREHLLGFTEEVTTEKIWGFARTTCTAEHEGASLDVRGDSDRSDRKSWIDWLDAQQSSYRVRNARLRDELNGACQADSTAAWGVWFTTSCQHGPVMAACCTLEHPAQRPPRRCEQRPTNSKPIRLIATEISRVNAPSQAEPVMSQIDLLAGRHQPRSSLHDLQWSLRPRRDELSAIPSARSRVTFQVMTPHTSDRREHRSSDRAESDRKWSR